MAALSFAGTGLHSILGIQHGPNHGCPAHQTSSAADPQVVAGDDRACDEAGCPICNYLAQARVAGEYFAIVVCSLGVSNDFVPPQAAVPAADLRPFEARGPPAAV
jgi:hypothetical protein